MKKKITYFLLVFLILFAFVACEEEKAPITITLYANFTYGGAEVIQAKAGDKVTLPDAYDLWDVQDKIFRGWSTSSSGYPEYEAYSSFSSKTSVSLYALWSDKVSYSLNEKGYYVVTNYIYSGERTYTIPDYYQGLPVKEWRASWGNDCNVTELIIPASITYISSLPKSVETVSVAAGNSVYKMDNNCLIQIDGEEKILVGVTKNLSYISSEITKIGNYVFAGSDKTYISIPYGVKEIGYGCFANCKNLTDISIPSSVTYIGSNAFENCTSLESITLSCNSSSTTYNFSKMCFEDYNGKVILDEGWTIIAKDSFSGASISEIVLPSTLKEIQQGAFAHAENLEKVKIPSNVTTIGWFAFSHNSPTIVIDCTDFTSTPSGWMSNWNYGQTTLFKNTVYDDDYVYSDNTKSQVLALRDRSKTEYTFPESVKSIGERVFNDTPNLNKLILPEGIETLLSDAIYNTLALETLSLPSTLKSIGSYAIAHCQFLKEVKYNGTVENWNKITKNNEWSKGSGFTKIICTDGEVTL